MLFLYGEREKENCYKNRNEPMVILDQSLAGDTNCYPK